MKITGDYVDILMSAIDGAQEFVEFKYKNKGFFVLEKEYLDWEQEEWEIEDMGNLYDVVGYKVMVKHKGKHTNDGQLVDYTFNFISPAGKETKIKTEMCLMIGFNNGEDIEI